MARYDGIVEEANIVDDARRALVPVAIVAIAAWAIALLMQETLKPHVPEAYEPGDALKHMKRFQDGGE